MLDPELDGKLFSDIRDGIDGAISIHISREKNLIIARRDPAQYYS